MAGEARHTNSPPAAEFMACALASRSLWVTDLCLDGGLLDGPPGCHAGGRGLGVAGLAVVVAPVRVALLLRELRRRLVHIALAAHLRTPKKNRITS